MRQSERGMRPPVRRGVGLVASLAFVVVGSGPSGAQPGGDDDERQAILDAHEAAIEARRASLDPPDVDHPAIATTMTAAAFEGWTRWVGYAADDPSDAFVFAPPIDHRPLAVAVEEVDGAQLAFVIDCQLEQGELRRGASFEPAPDPDPAHRNTQLGADIMAKVDGGWKLALFMGVTPGERGTLGCMAG
jgi:hypothetical protein